MPLEFETEDMSKDVYFIEPSTGEWKDISDGNYIGIESIWNHTNYWVNLQPINGGCTVSTIICHRRIFSKFMFNNSAV